MRFRQRGSYPQSGRGGQKGLGKVGVALIPPFFEFLEVLLLYFTSYCAFHCAKLLMAKSQSNQLSIVPSSSHHSSYHRFGRGLLTPQIARSYLPRCCSRMRASPKNGRFLHGERMPPMICAYY